MLYKARQKEELKYVKMRKQKSKIFLIFREFLKSYQRNFISKRETDRIEEYFFSFLHSTGLSNYITL